MLWNKCLIAMANKGKTFSSARENSLSNYKKEGASYREIAGDVGRQYSLIERVVRNFKSTGEFSSKSRSGRPSMLPRRERRSVLTMVKKKPRLTAREMTIEIKQNFKKQICPDTIRETLEKAGYRGRIAP